jgi:predicted PurR-regulated permease PerM
MTFNRPIVFWIAMLAAIVAAVALLREVLLPFVAGAVLAYVFNPLATRLERLGINRLLATLLIVACVFALILTVLFLTVPVLVRELSDFVENFPAYLERLHNLAKDPARPWVSKIFAEGLAQAERSFGELTSLATGWLGTFLHSAWSGGRALISVISIGIVAPIVGVYLTYDWNKMIAWIDKSVPPRGGKPCARLRARSTLRSAASCAARACSVSRLPPTMQRRSRSWASSTAH